MTDTPAAGRARRHAFGQDAGPSLVDRFGIWLSSRQMRRRVGGFAGKRVADVGCGYRASFSRSLAGQASEITLLDIALDPALAELPGVRTLTGELPGTMSAIADASIDVLICNSVLEHLWRPDHALAEFHRVLAPGGLALINVPSWRGKWFLEFSAFRLGTSPAAEMDDHKTYFDPRDLWPLLVAAGFRPRHIRCFKHKFGLNTFAECRKAGRG